MFSGHWMATIDTAHITCHLRHLPRQDQVFPLLLLFSLPLFSLPLLWLQTLLQLFLLHHLCFCHQQKNCWKGLIKSPICQRSLTAFEWKKFPCNETLNRTSLLDPNYWTNFPLLDCHRVKVTKSQIIWKKLIKLLDCCYHFQVVWKMLKWLSNQKVFDPKTAITTNSLLSNPFLLLDETAIPVHPLWVTVSRVLVPQCLLF